MANYVIIREGKIPPDHRTPLSPADANKLNSEFDDFEICIQPSNYRSISEKEYAKNYVMPCSRIAEAEVYLGIKEVAITELLPFKTYFYFSHTIKKQEHNKEMLRDILAKEIRLIDYELITNEKGKRILGFGKWAGRIGAYYGLWAYLKKTGNNDYKQAYKFDRYDEMIASVQKMNFKELKIGILGSGHVGNGCLDLLSETNLSQFKASELGKMKSGYCILGSSELYERKSDGGYERSEFHSSPELYQSRFHEYWGEFDIILNAVYWEEGIPRHFETNDITQKNFRLQTLVDISCDLHGSNPLCIKPSHTENPVYAFSKENGKTCLPYEENGIDVIAIDNLPNELATDASLDFSEAFLPLLKLFHKSPEAEVFRRATIAENGSLTEHCKYLEDWVYGRE